MVTIRKNAGTDLLGPIHKSLLKWQKRSGTPVMIIPEYLRLFCILIAY
jgi:hypothetical protein